MTVQFGDVGIPRDLLNAHETGKLVTFVGAGASVASPSCLPSFFGLTKMIRDESQLTDVFSDLNNQPFDEILDEIEDMHDVDVHLRAVHHTGKESSRPNDLHRGIADLAQCRTIRVVTTNYDTHLSTTLDADVTTYLSPALPIGSDFTGLVYLHGCVTQDPKQLVITASDFGRAYLTEAWATRFLERMFASYTTLFIGYSHNDVIMKYLARGLGPHAKPRYVFTHEPDSPMWRQLKIIPIGYSPADDHRALRLAIQGWANLASSGLLDHQRQVESVMADSRRPSDLTSDESSYLQTVVSDANAVQFFCEYAKGPEWLTWISDHPEFQALFDPTHAGTAVTWRLASWFAKTYITDDSSTPALAAFRTLGGKFSPQLWDATARQLLSLRDTSLHAIAIRPWLLLLTRNATDQSTIFLEMLLSKCSLPADIEPATFLFSYLTEPRVVEVPSVRDAVRNEIRLRGNVSHLHETWNNVFKPTLNIAAVDLLPMIDQHLRAAQRDTNLSDESGSSRTLGSPMHPIAISSGSRYSAPLDLLVEAARDCIEALLDNDANRAGSQLSAWASSDVVLLRRLAIHGWSVRTDTDASTKAHWLADQGLVLDYDHQSEIAPLIAGILQSNDTAAIVIVVADILDHANDDRYTPGRALRTLNWMRQPGVATSEIDNAIAELIRQHPDLTALQRAADSAPPEPTPRATADELRLLLANDIPGAVTVLQEYAPQEDRPQAIVWYDIENIVASAVTESPTLGFDLLDALDLASPIGEAVAGPVIRGWSSAIVDDQLAQQILLEISALDISKSARDVAGMLAGFREAGAQGTEWSSFPMSRDLAKACWEVLGHEEVGEVDDWFFTAVNSPAGKLAIYWLAIAEQEQKDTEGKSRGLSPDLDSELAALLNSGDSRADLVEVIFARDVTFLHSIDPDWCEDHILPLFDWGDQPRALRVWSGYLSGGRYTEDLLRAGLLQEALQAVSRASLFTEPLRHNLFGLFAHIAVHSTIDPATWVPTLIRNANTEGRVQWTDTVTDYLREVEPQEVEAQWERWMRSYWQDRLESVPRRINVQETSSMARWVVYLSKSVAEGVQLALRHRAAFDQYARLLDELSGQHIQHDPLAFTQLVSHLLADTQLPFYSRELPAVLSRFRSHGVEEQSLIPIKEQALRLGLGLGGE